jgi:hypothetical protein
MSTPIFNDAIRKITVGFGNIFNNIQLVRYNADGSESQRFLCSIEYASKEKYVSRIQDDPNLDKKVQISLPAISFEMTGLKYDESRKQATNFKIYAANGSITSSVYNPVPYDFDFNLYVYVRNQEDGNQIIERILPYFTPDYTIRINMVPQMNIVKDIPVVLNSIDYNVSYDGDYNSELRMIIWTLNFTVKGFIYNSPKASSLITHSITNIYNNINTDDTVVFKLIPNSGLGVYKVGESVYQGYSFNTAIATAKVVETSNLNNEITLTNISGNFTPSLPIIGTLSGANFKYSTTGFVNKKYVKIDVVPVPSTNVSNNWIANTTITEY